MKIYPSPHDIGILEMIDQGSRALNSSICEFTYFFAVKLVPSFAIEFKIEFGDELGIDEVDKSISNIARVVRVDRQIKEVVFVSMVFIDFINEHLLGIFIRDVSDHHCCPVIHLYL